ncbi:MAG: mechanosensitive ion channel family protein [Microcystaceae cyanobacterium]
MIKKLVRLCLIGLIIACAIVSDLSNHLIENFSVNPLIWPSAVILAQDSSTPDTTESPDTTSSPIPTEDSSSTGTKEENIETADVIFQGQTLFKVSKLGETSAEIRAQEVSEKINEVAQDYNLVAKDFKVTTLETLKIIQAGDKMMMALSQTDAEIANKSLSELADEYRDIIRDAIEEFRTSMTQEEIVRNGILAILSTIGFLLAFLIINRKLPHLFASISNWQRQRFNSIRYQGLQFLSSYQVSALLDTVFRIIRFSLLFLLFYFYVPFLLTCFPLTRSIGKRLQGYFWEAVKLVIRGFVDYLPNLFVIAVIVFIAYYAHRFARFIFNAIRRERIRINGFYPEWANPTYNITLFLIVGFAAVLIFPYLPASDSPGFQGISLFAGALFTLGSTAIIGNIISGIVLIYTRSFQVGDLIKANGISGKVIEKTMLSTRLMNFDNEIITIPNGSLIASEITNYSTVIRDSDQSLILKTTITLGYDVPWRKVHQVLIDAANASEGILKEPAPFVFQTSLDDFYVSYVLKVYTDHPEKMGAIYSQLHQNLQDKCNEADIEILSPHYSAIRDGNLITIPADYLDKNYQAPSFRVESLGQ